MTDYLINSPNTGDYPSKKINLDIYHTLNAKEKKSKWTSYLNVQNKIPSDHIHTEPRGWGSTKK